MLSHRLRHRITFQSPGHAQRDEDGYLVPGAEDWQTATLKDGTPLSMVPAEVLTGPGRERQASATTVGESSARMNLRWFPVSEEELLAWRVVWDGRVYNIASAETDITARREWRLRVTCGPSAGQ